MQKSVEIVFPLNCSHPIFLDETAVSIDTVKCCLVREKKKQIQLML